MRRETADSWPHITPQTDRHLQHVLSQLRHRNLWHEPAAALELVHAHAPPIGPANDLSACAVDAPYAQHDVARRLTQEAHLRYGLWRINQSIFSGSPHYLAASGAAVMNGCQAFLCTRNWRCWLARGETDVNEHLELRVKRDAWHGAHSGCARSRKIVRRTGKDGLVDAPETERLQISLLALTPPASNAASCWAYGASTAQADRSIRRSRDRAACTCLPIREGPRQARATDCDAPAD